MRPATSLMGVSRGREPSLLDDGLIGHAIHLGGEQPVGEFRQRRQVQVGEQDQPRTEIVVLGLLRLFDFDHQAGPVPHFRRLVEDGGAGLRCTRDR